VRAWLWVSHDPAQAARVSNRHLTMRAGVLDDARPNMPDTSAHTGETPR
jgi:putative ABC transport system ATP-binding protein